MAAEQLGEIVIAPRVLEKIIAIATAKVEGVYSFANKSMSDSLSMRSLGRGVSLHTDETGDAIEIPDAEHQKIGGIVGQATRHVVCHLITEPETVQA